MNIKPHHKELSLDEISRRIEYAENMRFNGFEYDKSFDITKPDGTVEHHNGYTEETWKKIMFWKFTVFYWEAVYYAVKRDYELTHPTTIHFEHKNIIITDLCYIFDSETVEYDDNYGPEGDIIKDTLYGDWSCATYRDDGVEIGTFCADAGMVCVYPTDHPSIDKDKLMRLGCWCRTIITDFTGDVSVIRHAGNPHEAEYDYITIEGKGTTNFSTRQTGF